MHLYMKKILFSIVLLVVFCFAFSLRTPAQAQENTQRTEQAEEVMVPAGKFWKYNSTDTLVMEIYLDEFYIDVFPVSVSDYAKCVQAGDCKGTPIKRYMKNTTKTGYPKDYQEALAKAMADANRMAYVTYNEAMDYCNAQGKRLPTDYEWEKTARGVNNKKEYSWGDTPPDCTNANGLECPNETAEAKSKSFAPSPYGTYNMISKFQEFTMGFYHRGFDKKKYPRNPLCTDKIFYGLPLEKDAPIATHQVRGGLDLTVRGVPYSLIWAGRADYEKANENTGFRCVRSKLMDDYDFNR